MYIYDMKIFRRIIAIFLIVSTASGVIDELTKYGNLTDDAVGGVIIAIIIVYFLLRNPKKKSEKTQIRNKDSEIVENLEDLEIERSLWKIQNHCRLSSWNPQGNCSPSQTVFIIFKLQMGS